MFQKRTKINLYLIETYKEKMYSMIVKRNNIMLQNKTQENKTTVRG